MIEVLTGFKFIGQQILGFENSGKGTYLFGFEESYGCLIGTYARDKDAIVATMALCEAAAYYKTQGKTLWDAMIDMYEEFGYYKDDIQSVTLKGMRPSEDPGDHGHASQKIRRQNLQDARLWLPGITSRIPYGIWRQAR